MSTLIPRLRRLTLQESRVVPTQTINSASVQCSTYLDEDRAGRSRQVQDWYFNSSYSFFLAFFFFTATPLFLFAQLSFLSFFLSLFFYLSFPFLFFCFLFFISFVLFFLLFLSFFLSLFFSFLFFFLFLFLFLFYLHLSFFLISEFPLLQIWDHFTNKYHRIFFTRKSYVKLFIFNFIKEFPCKFTTDLQQKNLQKNCT